MGDVTAIPEILVEAVQRLGFVLSEKQPHLGGERYLLSPDKYVLLGTAHNGERVVIKASNTVRGTEELQHERACRELLHTLQFATHGFMTPREITFTEQGGYTIAVSGYIEESKPFLHHELQEQFFMALAALEAQEGVHATTFAHATEIARAFGSMNANDYLTEFASFEATITEQKPDLVPLLKEASAYLHEHKTTIERYCGFLTHSDFVPHNMRIVDRRIYMLDTTSFMFGNKYESWARLLNFMVVHNPSLERMLVEYVEGNRSEDEYLSLRLMRVYKLGFLLRFYVQSLARTEGDLRALTNERIAFWARVLRQQLTKEPTSLSDVERYVSLRNTLQSKEEKERQKEIGHLDVGVRPTEEGN